MYHESVKCGSMWETKENNGIDHTFPSRSMGLGTYQELSKSVPVPYTGLDDPLDSDPSTGVCCSTCTTTVRTDSRCCWWSAFASRTDYTGYTSRAQYCQ